MDSLDREISANDFLFEYDYSEYTLACFTPLPPIGADEACFLSYSSPRAARIGGGNRATGTQNRVTPTQKTVNHAANSYGNPSTIDYAGAKNAQDLWRSYWFI
jgi:hypothetical protein